MAVLPICSAGAQSTGGCRRQFRPERLPRGFIVRPWKEEGFPMGAKKTAAGRRAAARQRRKWSGEVTAHSDALDLEAGIFRSGSPGRIARSLKHSAEASRRRKGSPYRSAMSMLTFYINRAGRALSPERRQILEEAKVKLREVFGR
jgi:hypothetical protein